MGNENKDELNIFAYYIGWAFLHLVFLAIGWNGDDHELFWPFQSTYVSKGEIIEAYDISEFLVYVIGPVVLFFIWAMVSDDENS